MTNREKYAEQILDIACSGDAFAMANGRLHRCSDVPCISCDFYDCDNGDCDSNISKWSNSEYVEPTIDWSKIAVDTPILVRNYETEPWYKRYFAKHKDGEVLTWKGGRTSWNAGGYVYRWKFAKLAKEANEAFTEIKGDD